MIAYPLDWPTGQHRTKEPINSRFGKKDEHGSLRDRTNHQSWTYLEGEIGLLNGEAPVISTNIRARVDGDGFLSKGKEPEDGGVAAYFTRKGKTICIACDTYLWVWENLWAVGRTVEGFRRMERDGIPGFLDRAFTGFTAIEDKRNWRRTFGLDDGQPCTMDAVRLGYRALIKAAHPDHGGTTERVQELQEALSAAERELT